jgi:hypothetical protein
MSNDVIQMRWQVESKIYFNTNKSPVIGIWYSKLYYSNQFNNCDAIGW